MSSTAQTKPVKMDRNTETVFSIIQSFTPNTDLAPQVFAKRSISHDEDARQAFKELMRAGVVKFVLPRIYSRRNFFVPYDFEPLPAAVAKGLCVQHGWRAAVPVPLVKFLLGEREKPGANELNHFYYDRHDVKHYEKINLSFEPAWDMSLFDLTPAGQIIRIGLQGNDLATDERLLKAAHFAASAWFRDPVFHAQLNADLGAGRLEGRELLLSQTIMEFSEQRISRVAPPEFNHADQQAAARIECWWIIKDETGNEYLSASYIEGHSHISDGDILARSTALVWIDESLGWARTRSRTYRLLGKRDKR
jgi:hypothetical protein